MFFLVNNSKMIICKECNATLSNKSKYCKECGAKVPDNIKFCENCHADILDNAKFCDECGARVEANTAKSFSALLVFLILVGAGLVVYRSVDLPGENTFNTNTTQMTIQETSEIKVKETSFQTLVFRNKPRNEVTLSILAPTTQALMIGHANKWVSENLDSNKIKDNEETRIDIYEKDSEKNVEILRARIIYINLDSNSDYSFPNSDYINIGQHMYVMWVSRENS